MKQNFIKKLNFDDDEKKFVIKKYNKIKSCENDFHYKYSNDNLYYRGEIALWKAVILQALVDLQSNSRKKIANTYRIKALMWFNLKNKEFITVCNYAGLDPQYVYEKSRIVKENNRFFI